MSNEKAVDNMIYVCYACGKRSKDKFGKEAISYGWDVSCVMNCGLEREEDLKIEEGLVVKINRGEHG